MKHRQHQSPPTKGKDNQRRHSPRFNRSPSTIRKNNDDSPTNAKVGTPSTDTDFHIRKRKPNNTEERVIQTRNTKQRKDNQQATTFSFEDDSIL